MQQGEQLAVSLVGATVMRQAALSVMRRSQDVVRAVKRPRHKLAKGVLT